MHEEPPSVIFSSYCTSLTVPTGLGTTFLHTVPSEPMFQRQLPQNDLSQAFPADARHLDEESHLVIGHEGQGPQGTTGFFFLRY